MNTNQLFGASGGVQTRAASSGTIPTEFTVASAQHMTQMTNPGNPSEPYERCEIQFQLPAAIIWQIKFILSSVQGKKSQSTASAEFANLSEGFGKEFDKYLLKELLEQIEIKDASKAAKDKTESVKITLLNTELTRASQKPEFLTYFSEILSSIFGWDSMRTKPGEVLQEITKRLKLTPQLQMMVMLSMLESTDESAMFDKVLEVFRKKLLEYQSNGKPEQLPEYSVHRILYLFHTVQELATDNSLRDAKQMMISANATRFSQFIPLRSSLLQDISQVNSLPDMPSYTIMREGSGLDHLEFVNKVIQPWEVLIDIGHNSSYMYDYLLKTLTEFRGIDEKVMALTILQLAVHHQGKDDHISKIVYNTFESNKDGNSASIKKEPEDKKTLMSWSIDNLARAFRELYSNLSWLKVFESFGEILDEDIPVEVIVNGLETKQFQTLIQLYVRSKPQNIQFPLQSLLSQQWKSSNLQFTFIRNCIAQFVAKKDKFIQFSKLDNKAPSIPDLLEVKERGESPETIEVWQSVDLVERLIILSESTTLFAKVRKTFEYPIQQLPEYLLISLSLAKPSVGNVLIDELLSILLPLFLGDHVNSSVVLQQLFKSNHSLFIRGICELCKHDQRLMNLSRVLDITQEVRASLLPIVYCEDYNFAVNLGILAGKRDFLHYDVWIKSRLKEVGSPFINALIKYIQEQIVTPVSDFARRNAILHESQQLTTQQQQQYLDNFEAHKTAVLERSHLSKDKLLLTIEHLQSASLRQNEKVNRDTLNKISALVTKTSELFPQHHEPGQNSEEIDAAANEHFQRVFSAKDDEVDQRIEELICTMQQFKASQEPREQEIYACMLHSLFDEYRFLHRYPQQYLTKIAKLFGAIIKNNLLDRVLQDIALKFVIEAFRRDGRRQKFGIIVIKSFFYRLPQFPKFLEDIYQIRSSIQASEPEMMAEIERLYLETIAQNQGGTPGAGDEGNNDNPNDYQSTPGILQADDLTNDQPQDSQNSQGLITGVIEPEATRIGSDGAPSSLLSLDSSRNGLVTDASHLQQSGIDKKQAQTKDQPKKNQQRTTNLQLPSNIVVQGNRNNPKNQRSGPEQQQQPVLKSMTPPIIGQAKEFIPTKPQGRMQLPAGMERGQTMAAQATTQLGPARAFIPAQKPMMGQLAQLGQSGQPQPSPLADHLSIMSVPGASFKPVTAQNTVDQSRASPVTQTGLNLRAEEFQKPNIALQVPPAFEPNKQQEINIHSKAFLPSRTSQDIMMAHARPIVQPAQVSELQKYKKKIDEKIAHAMESGTKLRLDDLLEDESITIELVDIQDQIRLAFNNAGRANFKQKTEELKKLLEKKPQKIADEKADNILDDKLHRGDENLMWLIQYILSKRLRSQGMNLLAIYVDVIRELNQSIPASNGLKTVIGLTLSQAAVLFKKCMVVDEDKFMKVTNVPQGSGAVIKGYLVSLGTFLGMLTVAKNEPIRSVHLDLKQLLIEGSQTRNSLLAVAFVCRILKESIHSSVFTPRNPWINSLLSLLKEIYDQSQTVQAKPGIDDKRFEIESLFKAINVGQMHEIKPHGILQTLQNPGPYSDQVLRRELEYMHKRVKLILPPQAGPVLGSVDDQKQRASMAQLSTQVASINRVASQDGQLLQSQAISSQYAESEMLKRQLSQMSQAVRVSEDLLQRFQRFPNISEHQVRKLVGMAVDNSIVEILPPVVDRSVTIALITTRELVLKDFAHDGDFGRVIQAARLIVQNLAGSLALVTCREPLRMSLTTNLKKLFESHFRSELHLEILRSNTQQNAAIDGSSDTLATSDAVNNSDQSQKAIPTIDSNGFQTQVTEEQVNEIAVLASRENLELGCRLIKKEVIEKALKKVSEDPQINFAVERRKRAAEQGKRLFKDDAFAASFRGLPESLRPDANGLSAAQFQVYADFATLGHDPDMSSTNQPAPSLQSQTPQNLTSILRQIDQYGLTEVNKDQLISKINSMNNSTLNDDDREKLWTYVQRNLETACKNYDSRNPQAVEHIIEVLSLIVTSYKAEDFSKKLLTNVFLQLDVRIFNEVELNILLLSKKIISLREWDSQLAIFFRESAPQLPESELQFFANFLEAAIVEKKILTKDAVPELITVIEQMQSNSSTIGKFCQHILATINFSRDQRSSSVNGADHSSLRDFFIKWVVMSYIDDKELQERQINTLFEELGRMGIVSEPRLLFSFCKVMVQTSIDKALIFGDTGEKRPLDRLDFRYIDSFVKLIVVLLSKFNFNKHEFMTQILEFIAEVLDQDHASKKAQFNQRPYFRILINILTAVNHSDCFNQKTHQLILYSMADLFKNLNPSQFPGFSFAWLELISHKQFLPHFLGQLAASSGSQQSQIQNQSILGQNQFVNISGMPNSSGLSNMGSDAAFYQKRFKIKDLIVHALCFLKNNMVAGQPCPPAIQAYYHGTLRVLNVIKQDFPDFLSDFHFNFVNSLPEHCIQMRNLILAAYPSQIQQPDPFCKSLKIDLLTEIKQSPRILSNFGNYLSLMNLREDLETYTRTRNQQLIQDICRKMEASEETVNGRRRINSNVISAVVLFIANWKTNQRSADNQRDEQREARDIFKQIVKTLDDETRLCFLNAIINELRYPNTHTFYFSCIILYIYAEADRESINEQISAIFLERLQTSGPYPWGLMISFRELIQIPKFQFMRRSYIRSHPQAITRLFQGQLRNFMDFVPAQLRGQVLQGNIQQQLDVPI